MKHDQHLALETALDELRVRAAFVIGRCAKHHVARARVMSYLLVHAALRSAKAARNLDAMESAVLKMEALPCGGHHLPQRKHSLEFLEVLRREAEVRAMLVDAISCRHLAMIEKALRAATQVGLTPETCVEVRNAHSVLDELEAEREARVNLDHLKALAESLRVSTRTANGPNRDVLSKLQRLYHESLDMQVAESLGCPGEYKDAGMVIHRAEQMLDAIDSVMNAAARGDCSELSDAIETAKDLGLTQQTDVVQAMSQLEEMDKTVKKPEEKEEDRARAESLRSSSRRASFSPEVKEKMTPRSLSNPDLPVPAKVGSMDRILKIASSSRWRIEKYRRLRLPETFARNSWMNKRRLMEGMLTFSPDVIPMSLLDLGERDNRAAVQLHKSLLAFTGVRKTTFPAACALDILQRGIESVELRDEILSQCCKNISLNSNHSVVSRTWVLLVYCICLFTPSVEFELYFLHFLIPFSHHQSWSAFSIFIQKELEQQLDMDERDLSELQYQRTLPRVEEVLSAMNEPDKWIERKMVECGWGWLLAERGGMMVR